MGRTVRQRTANAYNPKGLSGFDSHILRAVEAMHANKNIISEN